MQSYIFYSNAQTFYLFLATFKTRLILYKFTLHAFNN